jgi:hypothetical protein
MGSVAGTKLSRQSPKVVTVSGDDASTFDGSLLEVHFVCPTSTTQRLHAHRVQTQATCDQGYFG